MVDRFEIDCPQFFDPRIDHSVWTKQLPHWSQAGTFCFITWRTADSLPREVEVRLNRTRQETLRQRGLDPDRGWKRSLASLSAMERANLHWKLFVEWDRELDGAAGACILRVPELSSIVMSSFLHFNHERYVLSDAVVMPNHVHLLVAFRDAESLTTQCTSWKRFTARAINQWLRENGQSDRSQSHDSEFWQVEQFDHLVRSLEEFEQYRRYIAENPSNARLAAGSFRHFTTETASPDP